MTEKKYSEISDNSFIKDSIRISNLFDNQQNNKDTLVNSYDYSIAYGNLLNENYKSLIIKKQDDKKYYQCINGKWKTTIEYNFGAGFIFDSIYDINADTNLDIITYVTNTGNLTTTVYLQNGKNGVFKELKFFNAIFDNEKQLIRGYIKQNAPIVKFYKLKWNGLKLDTLEWVRYRIGKIPKVVIKSNKENVFDIDSENNYYVSLSKDQYKILKTLPKEYLTLDSIFHGNANFDILKDKK
ncbi:MAG: hypothetical protein ACPG44_05025 [Polaribacter sp.]